MCVAQGHDTVTPVRLKPAAPRSSVKHSTTEPLRSLENLILPMLSYPGCHMRATNIVCIELTHMAIKCLHCYVKVMSSCEIATYHIQGLLEAYFWSLGRIFLSYPLTNDRFLYECSCIIEFTQWVEEEIKCKDCPAFYLFLAMSLIN